MDKNKIIDELLRILYEVTKKDFKDFDINLHLLGQVWNLKPRELIYVYLEAENRFQITINEEDIVNNKFSTLAGISELICNSEITV